MRREYREVITTATGHSPVAKTLLVAAYASLDGAIEGARRHDAVAPDGTREIRYRGEILRCTYRHGRATTWASKGR